MAILGKKTTNLVRQASCLALLVLVVLHCAPMVQAQTDNSCLGIERQQLGVPHRPAWMWEAECKTAKEEAAERGISVEQALAEIRERQAREREWQEQREREWAEAERRRIAILTATAAIAVGVVVIGFKRRHRIGITIGRIWWGKSRDFRVWAFGGLFWGLANCSTCG